MTPIITIHDDNKLSITPIPSTPAMTGPVRPNPYDYSDYREFLADYVKYRKLLNYRYSARAFVRHSTVKSPSYLNMVIKGERDISPKTINGFAKAMELSPIEHIRFERLVLWNQSENREDSEYYKKTMPELFGLPSGTIKEARIIVKKEETQ